MNGKQIIRLLLLAFVLLGVVWMVVKETATDPGATGTAEPQSQAREVVAYYFHRTARCVTCLKIENQSRTEIERSFAAELNQGGLIFRSVNVEEPGNEHFKQEYQLVSQALVLVDYREGIRHRWQNLDQVWDLVHTEDQFNTYVRDEVRAFLEMP
ncbi:MAG TPA: nitrophenyl compound nitroreductase subunit ArsF family protein [Acidobacteriota bacterium]|nr:nitrophenyl compound nitroreductase subunit ArsF family protein [Acidobacteriota bacterium]